MAKSFDRAELIANDDGTYTISITPLREKEKSGSNEVMSYPDAKTYTAPSLAEAVGKIESFVGGDKREPESGDETDDLDGFMEPRQGESAQKEQDDD